MPRIRTAKQRSKRIDLHYFKRRYPLRVWRSVLSIALVSGALLWVATIVVTGNRAAYAKGPVSVAHRLIGERCESCHVSSRAVALAGIRNRIQSFFSAHDASDAACLTCHAAPDHNANEPFRPPCASCHLEHRALAKLAEPEDRSCTTCHRDLKTQTGARTIEASVNAFNGGHPEFAFKRNGTPDPTVLKFNHRVHAAGTLKIDCGTCHQPQLSAAAAPSLPGSRRAHGTGYMAPITYEDQCASCHKLEFDEHLSERAPHAKPEEVSKFVRSRLTNMAAARKAEQLLWNTTCALCHTLTPGAADLPEVKATAIPARWFNRARFDHTPHRLLTCASCHSQATTSADTSDVLLPNIATCQQCHRPERGARPSCYECHGYHDWSNETPLERQLTVPDVAGTR